jgi:hypothetical protein
MSDNEALVVLGLVVVAVQVKWRPRDRGRATVIMIPP